jgi:hypothetical protein
MWGVHGNKKPCSPFGKQGWEILWFVSLDWRPLLAGLVVFSGDLPGHAAAARGNDNVRDGAHQEEFIDQSRCHRGADNARNCVGGQAVYRGGIGFPAWHAERAQPNTGQAAFYFGSCFWQAGCPSHSSCKEGLRTDVIA